jgi:hypothetical protein
MRKIGKLSGYVFTLILTEAGLKTIKTAQVLIDQTQAE